MLIRVLKRNGDTSSPDEIEMETVLHIGDKFLMEYDWCKRIPCMNGYKADWYKDVAEFTVVDTVCNMLYKPASVWVRLHLYGYACILMMSCLTNGAGAVILMWKRKRC